MTKQELIEEIELLIKANKDNAYCEFEELSNMIKKVCNDTNYMSGNDQLNHRKQRDYYYCYGLLNHGIVFAKMTYLKKLERMILKIKRTKKWRDIFKIVKEAQRRIK